MDALLKDFKLGLRALAKKPASSAIAILAFGLGIGLCATIRTTHPPDQYDV